MIVARTRGELAEALGGWRERGPISLVPTMGFLHEGHLSLLDRAREHGGMCIVSIFVNPLQFGPTEDLDRYPRDEARDRRMLEERGADLAFIPNPGEVYPQGQPTVTVDPGPLDRFLCGPHRPGHFRGVLTVVAKLFGMVRPQWAVFGGKDFQQGVLVRRMAHDLELGVEIVIAPTVRDHDGLALSSRNAYLSENERVQATELYRALSNVRRSFADGARDARRMREGLLDHLAKSPKLQVQYAEVVHPDTLESVEEATAESVAALAVVCGSTRLIDNATLG